MRLDRSQEDSGKADQDIDTRQLTCFRTYGEEQYAARIARAIVHARHEAQIRTTGDWLRSLPKLYRPKQDVADILQDMFFKL